MTFGRWVAATVVLVLILAGASKPTPVAASDPFTDVPSDSYYARAVSQLSAMGVLDGTKCGAQLFCPDEPLRRGHMAVWLVRVLDGGDPETLPAETQFDDTGPDEWAFVERLYELGVTAGCGDGTRFCPNQPTTRAQMATFLVRALTASGTPPPPPPVVESCEFSAHSDTVRAATWQVHTGNSIGTAFYIGDGEWLTAAHVADGYDQVRLRQGTEELVAAVEAVVPDPDLALIRTAEPAGVQPLTLGNAGSVKAGSDVYVVGYPQYVAASAAVSKGVLSRIERWNQGEVVVTDAAMSPGNSGGPLVDECGRALGVVIVKWVELGVEGLGYAMGESTVRQYLPAMRAGEWKPAHNEPAVSTTGWQYNEGTLYDGNPYVTADVRDGSNLLYVRCVDNAELHVFFHGPDEVNIDGDRGYMEYQFGYQTARVGAWGPPGTSGNWLFLNDPTEFLADLWADTTGSLELHVWDYDEAYGDDYASLDAYIWQASAMFDVTGTEQHVRPVLTACGVADTVTTQPPTTTTPTPVRSAAGVAVGSGHSCAIWTDRTVTCWGGNEHGQAAPPGGVFTAVAAGDSHSCGLRPDGGIVCWGDNRFGQADPHGGEFTALAAGGGHSCGLRTDRGVSCWGENFTGAAGPPRGEFVAVASGGTHACAIRTDHTVTCWGNNDTRQTDVPDGEFTAISVGGGIDEEANLWGRSCGLRTGGALTCWGSGSAGAPSGRFISVAVGSSHSCGVRTDGSITCWGSNFEAQSEVPASGFAAVDAGGGTCAIRLDQTVVCWGSNAVWGDEPAGPFVAVAAGGGSGGAHGCGINPAGRLICWGHNLDGQSQPPDGQFEAVDSGVDHTCGTTNRQNHHLLGQQRLRPIPTPGRPVHRCNSGKLALMRATHRPNRWSAGDTTATKPKHPAN